MMRFLCAGAVLCPLIGCVPVPITGSIDRLDVPKVAVSPMAAGEALAILGSGDMGDHQPIPICVRSAAAKAEPGLRMLAPETLRDSLYPWFEPSTMPRTADKLALSLGQPPVRARVMEQNLRYVVIVTGSTASGPNDSFGAAAWGGLGSTWWTQTSQLSASIFDLKHAHSPGSVDLSVSTTGSLTAVSLLTVATIPVTETPACQELGRRLVAYLTGRPLPKAEPPPRAPDGAQ